MGYRSEMAIAIATEAVESFEAACPSIVEAFETGYDFNLDNGAPGGRCYAHKWIKWYESTGPDDEHGFLGTWEWAEWRGGVDDRLYRFICLGEENGDVEDYGDLYNINMYVVRGIELPANAGEAQEDEDAELL